MIWFILGGLVGLFAGAGLAMCIDDHKLIVINQDRWKRFIHLFLIYCVFLSGMMIYIFHWNVFSDTKYIRTVEDLLAAIFSNPVFQHLMQVAILLLFLVFILLLIKSPFIRWEHIKLLGFEAKTAIKEKAERQAKEELDYLYILEHLRLDTIELFSSDLTYEIIDQHIDVEKRQFNGKYALEELLDCYTILYEESNLNCSIRYGVITILRDEIAVSDYDEYMNLPSYVKEDIDYVKKSMTAQRWNHGEINTFVTPISFLDDQDVYYIIFLSSHEIEFNNLTEKQFNILKNLVENYVRLSDLKKDHTQLEDPMVQ